MLRTSSKRFTTPPADSPSVRMGSGYSSGSSTRRPRSRWPRRRSTPKALPPRMTTQIAVAVNLPPPPSWSPPALGPSPERTQPRPPILCTTTTPSTNASCIWPGTPTSPPLLLRPPTSSTSRTPARALVHKAGPRVPRASALLRNALTPLWPTVIGSARTMTCTPRSRRGS
jgi:hypothetical protein